jgi:hypothetical protein
MTTKTMPASEVEIGDTVRDYDDSGTPFRGIISRICPTDDGRVWLFTDFFSARFGNSDPVAVVKS